MPALGDYYMPIIPLIATVLLAPLAAFAFFGLLSLTGRNYSRQDLVSTGAMLVAFVCAVLLFTNVVADPDKFSHDGAEIHSLTWLPLGSVNFSMGFLFDSVTAVMLLVVTIVSSLVHIFSIGYMHGDPRYPRFFAFLSLFSFSMLFLVVSDNLLGIYIGWELVGVCSYLLIGFWFEQDAPANACKKAFMTTRVGDVGMFIGMMMLFTKFRTLSLYGDQGIFALASNLTAGDMTWLSIAGVLIFCGAIGKSAQIPLHTWLPDAMEGPTPVSALIHAATMVAAGVYLTARMFPILTADSSLFIAYVGGITALVAATIAMVRFDIKRVLAYSTISQLGYMMLAIGAGSYVAGLFHLTTHAFFKALLFLGSGSVIHAFHAAHHAHDHDHAHDDDHAHTDAHAASFDSFGIDPAQDMRHMGGLRHKMPITFVTMLIATLSIAGVPFIFSGFWSKDAVLVEVLYRAISWNSVHHYILFGMAALAAVITAFYMFRLIFMTFTGEPRNQEMHDGAHESPLKMAIPLIILAVLSFPIVNKWSFEKYVKQPDQPHIHAPKHARYDSSQGALHAQLGLSDAHAAGEDTHHEDAAVHHDPDHDRAHNIVVPLSFVIVILGIGLSALFYYWKRFSADAVAARLRPIYTLLWNKYYFDEFYDGVIVALTVAGSKVLGLFDLRFIDGIVNGVGVTVQAGCSRFAGWFDNTFVDGLVNLVARIIWYVGGRVRRVQTGMIQNYLLAIVGGVVLLILIFRALF
jgi:NADH-quinone oxidoreductase subunit L